MPACDPCGAEIDGAFLCVNCAQSLLGELSAVTGLLEDLDLTVSRQSVTGPGDGGRRGGETPLAFDEKAADAAEDLAAVLVRWCRTVASAADARALPAVYATVDPRDPARLPSRVTVPALAARLLVEHLDALRLLPEAGQAYADVRDATRRARRAVDRRVARMFVGACGMELDEDLCPRGLYVREGEAEVECPDCGTRWDVRERRAWLLGQVADTVGTTAQIAGLLSVGGVEVSGQTVRRWARHEKLLPVGADGRGRPLYRLGDAVEVRAALASARPCSVSQVTN